VHQLAEVVLHQAGCLLDAPGPQHPEVDGVAVLIVAKNEMQERVHA
jgi:hypothetical protein